MKNLIFNPFAKIYMAYKKLLTMIFILYYKILSLYYRYGPKEKVNYTLVDEYVDKFAKQKGRYFKLVSMERKDRIKAFVEALEFHKVTTVRPARQDEGPIYCSIVNEAYKDFYGRLRLDEEMYQKELRENLPLFIVNDKGTIVGTLLVDLKDNGTAEFTCTAIKKEFQRKGFVKLALRELLRSFWDEKFRYRTSYAYIWVAVPVLFAGFCMIGVKCGVCVRRLPNIFSGHPEAKNEIFRVGMMLPKKEGEKK